MTDLQQSFISPEDIEALKTRDVRWKQVDLAIKVDEELRQSPTVNLILEALTRRSTEAMELLINADPLDTRRITSLQEQVNCARFIGQSLHNIRQAGLVAQQSLEDEGNVELDSELPPDARSER